MSRYVTLLEKQWDNKRVVVRYFEETGTTTLNSYHINTEWKRNYQEKLKLILKQLKINGCAICGYDKCDRVLEFHHVNPGDKKFCVNLGTLQRRDENVMEELTKCVLLCANCHGEIEEKQNRIVFERIEIGGNKNE